MTFFASARDHLKPWLLCGSLLCTSMAHHSIAAAADEAATATANTSESIATAEAPPPVHYDALPLGSNGRTPAALDPAWLLLLALVLPAATWVGMAWKRALDEDPTRLRRSGVRELRKLLARMRRAPGMPEPQYLHAWLRATARTWGVGVSAPTGKQVTQATLSLTGDEAVTRNWRELWQATERGLFAAGGRTPNGWLDEASRAAAAVVPPRRERLFPNRLAYWIPSLAAATLTLSCFMSVQPARADVDEAAAAIVDLTTANEAALKALEANWNDWAAHYNVAAYNIQHENWNAAIAHATASFLLNPSAKETRDNLRYAITQAQTMDSTLRPMLFGSWYQRIPVLLSASGWQRLGLFAGLLLTASLTALVLSIYLPIRKPLLIGGGGGLAAGLIVMTVAISSWNAYGKLHDATACILLQPINLSPAPTDLVPREETSPANAGTIVQTRRSFLTWSQIAVDQDHVGWVRRTAVMPLYARAS
ncbi:hypothetical protein [Hydrocarboniphaga effusa]|uniref:hypothetical protein n=1 Tax=Hydrocarboniphaga effusa TaxID=243629 RepID=UPI0035B4F6EB